jgi:hypothetical protein
MKEEGRCEQKWLDGENFDSMDISSFDYNHNNIPFGRNTA